VIPAAIPGVVHIVPAASGNSFSLAFLSHYNDRMKYSDTGKGGGGGVAVALAVVLLMLPVLYVLSTGPVSWLVNHRTIPVDGPVLTGLTWFYAPFRLVRDYCAPFEQLTNWYIAFFR
jgi:hypothetical protein